VFALGFLELAEGLDAVVSATRDENATVRGCAAYALAAIGRPEAAAAAERLLADEHEVRSWNSAPWRSSTRVKDIANAALRGELTEPIRSDFPSKLYKRIASRNLKELK
jgi:HEAT repeat protein